MEVKNYQLYMCEMSVHIWGEGSEEKRTDFV